MTMPGWRSSGFRPRPSAGVKAMLFAGWKVWAAIPAKSWYSCANGFSKARLIPRKNDIVIPQTTMTHGRNSRSRSHLRRVTREVNADISQDQNRSEPACPPHQAVTFK